MSVLASDGHIENLALTVLGGYAAAACSDLAEDKEGITIKGVAWERDWEKGGGGREGVFAGNASLFPQDPGSTSPSTLRQAARPPDRPLATRQLFRPVGSVLAATRHGPAKPGRCSDSLWCSVLRHALKVLDAAGLVWSWSGRGNAAKTKPRAGPGAANPTVRPAPPLSFQHPHCDPRRSLRDGSAGPAGVGSLGCSGAPLWSH